MNNFHLVLGSVAASIATLVIVVTIDDPSPAPSDPFNGLHFSAPDNLADDEILNAPFVSYQSDSMEYKVRFPGTWLFDDSKTAINGHILTDPKEHVVITITETMDENLRTPKGTQAVAKSIHDSYKFDAAFRLRRFDRLLWRGHQTMFTEGTRTIGGETYHTREYNIVRSEHTSMLNVSITTKESVEELYEKPIQEILKSLEVCHDLEPDSHQ